MKYASLPIGGLHTWAQFNGISFNGITIANTIASKDGADKGAGLIASTGFSESSVSQDVLLTVPADLVLSKEAVHLCAKADLQLKEIIDAAGDFVESPRKAILVFLLFLLAHSSPDLTANQRGVPSPFADYVKFLPKTIPLPTFYKNEERDLLRGTSLQDALEQKLASLEREFKNLKEATSQIGWCQRYWWDDEEGVVTLDDWKLVDAIYRSRALDLPGIGHSMVPVLDMANHVSDNKRNARFEVAADGNVLLVREDGITIENGEEVNITYGAGGACETIFSYGFLDEGATSARELFLSLEIPLDDPLRIPKRAAAQEAPGIRVFVDPQGMMQWEGALVWWAVVNEEDGLDFQVMQCQNGARELKTLWKNEEVQASELKDKILADDLCDIFRLRATVMVQERIEKQGSALVESEDEFAHASQRLDHAFWDVLNKLRSLEMDLLTSAFDALEKQKTILLARDTVVRFLSTTPTNHEADNEWRGDMEDDFS